MVGLLSETVLSALPLYLYYTEKVGCQTVPSAAVTARKIGYLVSPSSEPAAASPSRRPSGSCPPRTGSAGLPAAARRRGGRPRPGGSAARRVARWPGRRRA